MPIDESRVNELPESVRIALQILDDASDLLVDVNGEVLVGFEIDDDMRYRIALASAIMQAYGVLAANNEASIWK